MSDATVVRSGQVNQAGDLRAIFKIEFESEIMKKFQDTVQMQKWTRTKRIGAGKACEFPYTSSLTVGYHQPGTQQLGNGVNNAKKVVTLDEFMSTHIWVNKIDELMEHFDNRSAYVDEMGNQLAITRDEHIMIEGLIGANAAAIVTGSPAGTQVANDNLKIDGAGAANAAEQVAAFAASLKAMAIQFDLNNVPEMGRYCVVRPELYHAITSVEAVQTNGFSFFNKDYAGADGSLSTNSVPKIHGFEIEKSNHLPNSNITQGADPYTSKYYYHFGDFSKTIALCGVKDAIATLLRQDIKVEIGDYDKTRKATFIGADYLSGHDYLRPECLGEIKLNLLSN